MTPWKSSDDPLETAEISAPTANDPVEPFPDRLGNYLPERLIGRGATAAVYVCRDPSGEHVAVKWLDRPSDAAQRSFQREIRALARVRHPSVVRYLDHGKQRGRPFLVMEYLDGVDLRVYARQLQRRPPSERIQHVRRIALELAEALHAVHSAGLIHRDIKPSNIRVLPNGRAVLTDFGVVKDQSVTDETAGGGLMGTLAYAAPEQIRGEAIDARTDLYGLGFTLYRLLVDRRPFEGMTNAEMMHAHLNEPVAAPSTHDPTVPPDLDEILLRLTNKSPNDRFSNAQSVAEALAVAQPWDELTLAGRQGALSDLGAALERAGSGTPTTVQIAGLPGTGRTWMLNTLAAAARRKGIAAVVTESTEDLSAGLQRLADDDLLLLATSLQLKNADVEIKLEPLRPADVRRSVVAANRNTPDAARLAERLHFATGGFPALIAPLLRLLTDDPQALANEWPAQDAGPWLDGLDQPSLQFFQAVAAAGTAAPHSVLEEATGVAPATVLPLLIARGLVRETSFGSVATANLLAEAALRLRDDADALVAHLQDLLDSLDPTAETALDDDAAWETQYATVLSLRESGHVLEAESKLMELQELAEQEGNVQRTGRALAGLGSLAWTRGEKNKALEFYDRAVAIAPEAPIVVATVKNGCGIIAVQDGDIEGALEAFSSAAAGFKRSGRVAPGVMVDLNLSEAYLFDGNLYEALGAAERAADQAKGLRNRALEVATLRHLSLVLLATGSAEQAEKSLADATALARAVGLTAPRRAAHVLRAQATLEAHPGDRAAAAAAADRLLRQIGRGREPDPEGHLPLAYAILARAAAALGDGRMLERTSLYALRQSRIEPVTVQVPLQIHLSKALLTAGRTADAIDYANRAATAAKTFNFRYYSWEAERILAAVNRKPMPAPGEIANGLTETQTQRLINRPITP